MIALEEDRGLDVFEIIQSVDPVSKRPILSLKEMSSYNGRFKSIIWHGTRIILDDKVFNIHTGEFIHELEDASNILDGVHCGESHIITSHGHYSKMSLYHWDGT